MSKGYVVTNRSKKHAVTNRRKASSIVRTGDVTDFSLIAGAATMGAALVGAGVALAMRRTRREG
jgi:hypothetical protein